MSGLVKRTSGGEYTLHIEDRAVEENGTSFTKIGKFCLDFLNLNFIYKHPIFIFPISPFNMTISTFIY